MSRLCTGIRSWACFSGTRFSEAERFRTPLAFGSLGLSEKTSEMPRPRMSSHLVMVADRDASLTATMGRSGASTRYNPGEGSMRARKSGSGCAFQLIVQADEALAEDRRIMAQHDRTGGHM